jgi:hypothetical protein
MLKLGICEPRHDTPAQRFFRRGAMSASLLHLSHPGGNAERERFERLMPHLCLSNGVARTTARRRFTDLDERLQQFLTGVFPPGYQLIAEDWAVSSGITAQEWFERLRIDYPEVRLTASDKILYLIEARHEDTGATYILEPDGTAIQYIRPPFVVSLVNRQHWIYPVNRRLQKQAISQWRQLAVDLNIPKWNGLAGADCPIEVPPFRLRRLPLLHPDVMALCGDAFRIREHSVFAALDIPVDVIRTMNILNRAYFDDATLCRAIDAVGQSLKPGGVWMVGRSGTGQSPQHDATLYSKQRDGWEVLFRAGGGSEIDSLVQSLASSPL